MIKYKAILLKNCDPGANVKATACVKIPENSCKICITSHFLLPGDSKVVAHFLNCEIKYIV